MQAPSFLTEHGHAHISPRGLYAGAYLPYLGSQTPREFQPTVLTLAPITKPEKQSPDAGSLSSPRRNATEGSHSSVMLSLHNSRHQCQVCGDSASGVHYGVQTCEGCKSFFKRSLQGKGQSFVCAADNKCQVDKRLRRNCAACRLRVCHQVGMKSNGVRKRKLEKAEKRQHKLFKTEPIEEQLELRGTTLNNNHQLPLSPISLPSSPCSPNPSNTSSTTPNSPTREHHRLDHVTTSSEAEQKSRNSFCIERQLSCPTTFAEHVLSQRQRNDTIGLTLEDYDALDNNTPTETALCLLFQYEIPSAIQWAKTIPGYRSLPLEDQVRLTRTKCLDLLMMSVVCQSSLHSSKGGLHFSLSKAQYDNLKKQNSTGKYDQGDSIEKIKEKITMAVVAPLKIYAHELLSTMKGVISRYQSLKTSKAEFEMLKMLIFTNMDSNLQQNIGQVDLLNDMQNFFRSNLRLHCIDMYGSELGGNRYEELLMTLTLVKDLGTRLESCMTQQSETLKTVTSIFENFL